jgi:hypothetical protein
MIQLRKIDTQFVEFDGNLKFIRNYILMGSE